MKLFEGKSQTERNKIIAAIALGLMCLVVFYFAFGRGLFSGSGTTTVKVTATPKPADAAKPDTNQFKIPSKEDQYLDWTSTPISYDLASVGAPRCRQKHICLLRTAAAVSNMPATDAKTHNHADSDTGSDAINADRFS